MSGWLEYTGHAEVRFAQIRADRCRHFQSGYAIVLLLPPKPVSHRPLQVRVTSRMVLPPPGVFPGHAMSSCLTVLLLTVYEKSIGWVAFGMSSTVVEAELADEVFKLGGIDKQLSIIVYQYQMRMQVQSSQWTPLFTEGTFATENATGISAWIY